MLRSAEGHRRGDVSTEQLATIEDVLEQSDFVSLHCPGGAENRHLIDAPRLARMKPGAFLINTARGDVVDQDALVEALGHDLVCFLASGATPCTVSSTTISPTGSLRSMCTIA